MTITIAPFSGITDGAPASPSYLNSKFSQLVSSITGLNANLPVTVSGVTVTGDPGYYFSIPSLDSGGFGYNLRAFPLSSGSDYAAVLRSVLSVANGGTLLVPPGNYYLGSTVTLSKQIKMFGAGGQGTTTFIKTHTGNMFDVTVANVEMHHIDLEGDSTVASVCTLGYAVRVTGGTNTTNFKFLSGAVNSLNSGFRFDDDSGGGTCIDNTRIATLTGEGSAISIGDATGAVPFFLSNIHAPNGIFSFGSVADVFVANCQPKRIDTQTNSFGVHTVSNRYGNSGSTVTFAGDSGFHMGNSIAGTCVLDSGFDGAFIGNVRTSGNGLVDNTGASGALIIDHNLWKVPSTATFNLGTSRLKSIRTLALTSLTSANLLDQELAVGFGASGCSLAYRSSGTVWYPNSSLSTVG